jgi:hypothetical protein
VDHAVLVSLDWDLYAPRAESVRPHLPRRDEWEEHAGIFSYAGDGWLLHVTGPESIPAEGIPPDLRPLAEDITHRVGFSLEPIGAPKAGYKFLEETVNAIARGLGCVGYDPKTGTPRSWAS